MGADGLKAIIGRYSFLMVVVVVVVVATPTRYNGGVLRVRASERVCCYIQIG